MLILSAVREELLRFEEQAVPHTFSGNQPCIGILIYEITRRLLPLIMYGANWLLVIQSVIALVIQTEEAIAYLK